MMAVAKQEYDWAFARENKDKLERLLRELQQIGVTTGDTVTYIKLKMADATRQINNYFNKDKMEDDLYEFRYEAHGGEFKLKCWHDGKEDTIHGSVFDQPEWLTGIVDVAKVAGHLKTPISPPPEAILWFHTDKNRTLINFIELAP
jgi:hypothetical protein